MKGIKLLIEFLIFLILVFWFTQSNSLAVSYSVNFAKGDLSFGQENEFQTVLLKGCHPMGEIGKPSSFNVYPIVNIQAFASHYLIGFEFIPINAN